jgi:hypothetical protein
MSLLFLIYSYFCILFPAELATVLATDQTPADRRIFSLPRFAKYPKNRQKHLGVQFQQWVTGPKVGKP